MDRRQTGGTVIQAVKGFDSLGSTHTGDLVKVIRGGRCLPYTTDCCDSIPLNQLEPHPLPFSPPLWEIALVEIYRAELYSRLGSPHFIDPEGNGLGVEHVWGFILKPAGQRLLVVLYLLHGTDPEQRSGTALLHADPPALEPILAVLGIEPTDRRVTIFPPVLMR